MKVSAVVIAYNEEEYIKDCLESLVNQIEKADEIILVDNNSIDRTVEIAKEFPEVRIVTEEKQGMIYARNKGFDAAKYEIIARLDADVRLPKDWIKKIKQNFKNKKIDALSGPVKFYDLPKPFTTKIFSNLYSYGESKIYNHKIMIGPNLIIRKDMWEKVKDKVCLKDSHVHEDVDLSIHIADIGGKIEFDESLVVDFSARRLKHNPLSFFLGYPWKQVKTRYVHR